VVVKVTVSVSVSVADPVTVEVVADPVKVSVVVSVSVADPVEVSVVVSVSSADPVSVEVSVSVADSVSASVEVSVLYQAQSWLRVHGLFSAQVDNTLHVFCHQQSSESLALIAAHTPLLLSRTQRCISHWLTRDFWRPRQSLMHRRKPQT
jgi:hypothetical protein